MSVKSGHTINILTGAVTNKANDETRNKNMQYLATVM